MKKFCFVALTLLTIFVVVSCASTPRAGKSSLPDIVKNARKNAPEGVLIGIGSAKLATQNQSRTVAETRARAEISRAISTIVQDMVRDYTASSEVDRTSALSFQEQITVALSKSSLQGAVIVDEDYIDETYYVVIYLNKADVVREISQARAAQNLQPAFAASMFSEDRMYDAFDRESGKEPRVADFD